VFDSHRTDLVENKFGKTQKPTQVSLVNATFPQTPTQKPNLLPEKQAPGELTQMINQFSEAE
jgi:hypothetical protein